MLFAASLLSLAAVVSAQMTVQVGFTSSDPGGIFQFKPNNFMAPNGTVVTFQFIGAPGNHTVTQSTFADPCTPASGGFDSGWVFIPGPPSPAVTQTPQFNLTITNDSKPIWFFCKQLLPSPHCGAGMVGAINAPSSGNTFAAFQKAAMGTKSSGQNQGGLVGIGASASAGVNPIPAGVTAYTGIVAAATGTASGASASATSPAASGSAASGSSAASGTAPAASGSSTASSTSDATKVVSSLVGLGAAVMGLILL